MRSRAATSSTGSRPSSCCPSASSSCKSIRIIRESHFERYFAFSANVHFRLAYGGEAVTKDRKVLIGAAIGGPAAVLLVIGKSQTSFLTQSRHTYCTYMYFWLFVVQGRLLARSIWPTCWPLSCSPRSTPSTCSCSWPTETKSTCWSYYQNI